MLKRCTLYILLLTWILAIIPQSSASASSDHTIANMDGSFDWCSVNSIEEYEKEIQTLPLPDNFIPFHRLQHLGDFVSFAYCIYRDISFISVWNYRLRDSSGYEFIFTVGNNHKYDPVYDLPRFLFCGINDPRTLSRGTYRVDGINFVSFPVKDACEIQWYANGSEYNIFYSDGYDPKNTDSILYRITNTRTAHETIHSLLDELDITHDLQISPVGTLRFVPVYVVSALCLLLIGVCFIRRKIRKRKQKYAV